MHSFHWAWMFSNAPEPAFKPGFQTPVGLTMKQGAGVLRHKRLDRLSPLALADCRFM
jgi:hypothetical protein